MYKFHCLMTTLLLSLTLACTPSQQAPEVDVERLSQIVKVLASDEFEGRAPGGPGEPLTVAYLIEQFQALGLEPGADDGSWTQAVPLINTRLQSPTELAFTINAETQALVQSQDIAVNTVRPLGTLSIEEAPVVFVGFGVSAPERQWDDFGDIDLDGKVALFLVNDPDFAAAETEPVAGLFGNRRMTYYGRWAYKFEEAARRGAIAALVIHEDKAAGYGWGVASSSPGENYALAETAGNPEPVAMQGWLREAAARNLFSAVDLDLDEQRTLARRADFQAFVMEGVSFSASAGVTVEHLESQNVLARLPGTDRAEETIMVSAHWDAFGQGEPDAQGRTVRPGANDDALGTAGVIELARVLKAQEPMQRSVVFALWTAEESGLLGSTAYASDPVYPLETTAANFTLDILMTAGPTRDVILVGEGQSELEDDLARAAAQQGRVVTPESLPENGLFYRADHFPMARQGVPVLLIMAIAGGADLVEGGRAAGDQWIADYVGNCYHQTCDAWSPDWDLRGAAMDIELFHTIIRDLGNSSRWPQWRDGSEFKATRDSSAQSRIPGSERKPGSE
jgi:Zn-dependent M28 family amino/carboxypeptidase